MTISDCLVQSFKDCFNLKQSDRCTDGASRLTTQAPFCKSQRAASAVYEERSVERKQAAAAEQPCKQDPGDEPRTLPPTPTQMSQARSSRGKPQIAELPAGYLQSPRRPPRQSCSAGSLPRTAPPTRLGLSGRTASPAGAPANYSRERSARGEEGGARVMQGGRAAGGSVPVVGGRTVVRARQEGVIVLHLHVGFSTGRETCEEGQQRQARGQQALGTSAGAKFKSIYIYS